MELEKPQFQYWSLTQTFELQVLSFVRSIREANFELYISTLIDLMPWFFALDHLNYARWLSVHIRDMITLDDKHPNIAQRFKEGKFTVRKFH